MIKLKHNETLIVFHKHYSGWTKELSLVKSDFGGIWYCINDWNDNYKNYSTPMLLSKYELIEMKKALADYIDKYDELDNTFIRKEKFEFGCEILTEGHVIRVAPNGWLQLNIVNWNNQKKSVFDIRPWNDNRTLMKQGITLTKNNAIELLKFIETL